jgi:hypothetical protein
MRSTQRLVVAPTSALDDREISNYFFGTGIGLETLFHV